MTTTTQQLPPNPARDFANAIRAETNDGRDLIDMLHEIAQGNYDATTNDQITAAKILADRGLGKCSKQSPATNDPVPNSEDEDAAATPESPAPANKEKPASPRLVTQIDDALNDTLGPAPGADQPTRPRTAVYTPLWGRNTEPHADNQPTNSLSTMHSPLSTINASIQDHILKITDNGRTIRSALIDIAFADPEDKAVIPFHRNRAITLLLDRLLGTNPLSVTTELQPGSEPDPNTVYHPDYPAGYIPDPTKDCVYCSRSLGMKEGHEGDHLRDLDALEKAHAEFQRMVDEGIFTPDPNAKKIDITPYLPRKGYVPHPDELRRGAAKFWADIELRYERQQQWPEVEERRRKKLAQIYPSHSEDSEDETTDADPPDP